MRLAARAPVRHERHAAGDDNAQELAVELGADLNEVGVVSKRYAPLEMTCRCRVGQCPSGIGRIPKESLPPPGSHESATTCRMRRRLVDKVLTEVSTSLMSLNTPINEQAYAH